MCLVSIFSRLRFISESKELKMSLGKTGIGVWRWKTWELTDHMWQQKVGFRISAGHHSCV